MCVPYHPEKLGENLERILTDKGMSMDDLAGKIGMSADEVKSWEKDFPDMEVIARACSALECNFTELLAQ